MNDIRCGYNDVVNPKITLVQGNTLELTVSLKQRVRTFNGTEWVTTETAYTPSEDEVVTVELRDKKRRRAASYVAEVNGSNATIREEGTLPIGIYEVSVIGRGGTNPWRYAEDVFVEVIKWTADAPDEDEIATGQVVAYDMDVVTYDIFRGNGIESIRKTSTVGNVDTYTITFTYGEPTTFTVTNAAGVPAEQMQEIIDQVLAQIDIPDPVTVDDNLDPGSSNPVKNSAIANAIAGVEDNIIALQEAVFPLAVTLTLSPSLAENNGQSRNVTASWTVKRNNVSVSPESLTLTVGGSQVTVNRTDTSKVLSLSATTSVTVQATYAGMTKSASKTVTFVLPMYFGFSASASGITPSSLTKQSLKTSPDGSYSLNNSTTGNYMWLCVPSSMSIGTVKSGGFDVPMEAAVTVSGYKCYRSSAALTSGTWDIVIS